MESAGDRIEGVFPELRGKDWRVTSSATRRYNCIAWAAGDTSRWWWPGDPADGYWPAGIERTETLSAFKAAFSLLGYEPCETWEAEPGYEKVAIFADLAGIPTHAARQLTSGRWTSKLGNWEDIEHNLQDICGDDYGAVDRVMRRPLSADGNQSTS
jgi:hypothetical protein